MSGMRWCSFCLETEGHKHLLGCVQHGGHQCRVGGDCGEAPGQPKSTKDAEIASLKERLERAIPDYVEDHGIKCDCCQHVMIDVTAIGTNGRGHCTAGDPEGDGVACAHGMAADQERLRERLERAQAALLRNRQGLLNILEMRYISGRRYGALTRRYGALTREEIESAIAEIDAAIAKQPESGLRERTERSQ